MAVGIYTSLQLANQMVRFYHLPTACQLKTLYRAIFPVGTVGKLAKRISNCQLGAHLLLSSISRQLAVGNDFSLLIGEGNHHYLLPYESNSNQNNGGCHVTIH